MDNTPDRMMKWFDLAAFQANVARRWFDRARQYHDPFVQFFFCFAALNALYFLWAHVDDLKNDAGGLVGEEKQIDHLLRKLPEVEAVSVLERSSQTTSYLARRPPIQRMDRRKPGQASTGDDREGRKWQRQLQEGASPVEKLVALGRILYLVRSNLVHGSKTESGDDLELIQAMPPALREVGQVLLAFTEEEFNLRG